MARDIVYHLNLPLTDSENEMLDFLSIGFDMPRAKLIRYLIAKEVSDILSGVLVCPPARAEDGANQTPE